MQLRQATLLPEAAVVTVAEAVAVAKAEAAGGNCETAWLHDCMADGGILSPSIIEKTPLAASES